MTRLPKPSKESQATELGSLVPFISSPKSPENRPTVTIVTQGCKLNQADSEVLARRFAEAGYSIVDAADGPQIFVLNTCTVTGTADAKARRALRSARRSNPESLVVATGCYAQRAPLDLEGLEAVSMVIGNSQKDELVSIISSVSPAPVSIPELSAKPPRDNGLDTLQQNQSKPPQSLRTRANIKIQEGCDQICAYCIVPKVRGRERSIPVKELVEQINHLVRMGFKEVVLTGTQLGTYGFDLHDASLVKLLRQILSETTVPRIRVSSLQAQEISPELLDLWENPRLCPHFHIPLQSGSDPVLKAMRRRYDTQTFAAMIDIVRHRIPDAGITTDIIVGFPGEDDSGFQESLRFSASMAFSDMHVFPYSPRPGTSAAHFINHVPDVAKKERAAEMLAVANLGFKAFRDNQLGTTRPVLWEKVSKKDRAYLLSGLTDNYIRVYGQSHVNLTNVIVRTQLIDGKDGHPRAVMI